MTFALYVIIYLHISIYKKSTVQKSVKQEIIRYMYVAGVMAAELSK